VYSSCKKRLKTPAGVF
jgi:hypothetical protein